MEGLAEVAGEGADIEAGGDGESEADLSTVLETKGWSVAVYFNNENSDGAGFRRSGLTGAGEVGEAAAGDFFGGIKRGGLGEGLVKRKRRERLFDGGEGRERRISFGEAAFGIVGGTCLTKFNDGGVFFVGVG